MSANALFLLLIALCCAVVGYLYKLGQEPRTTATWYGFGTFFLVLGVAIEVISLLEALAKGG